MANARTIRDVNGKFKEIPKEWPRWKLQCHATNRKRGDQCKSWTVMGMPTCRFHGSGGARNRELGRLRYLCWVVIGGPQNMPVAMAAQVALSTMQEMIYKQGVGTPEQQMRAALWLTELLG